MGHERPVRCSWDVIGNYGLIVLLLVEDRSLGGRRIAGRVFGGGRAVGSWRGHKRRRFGNRIKAIEQILLLLLLLLLPVCVSQFNSGQLVLHIIHN